MFGQGECQPVDFDLDFETALRCLCQEYLVFERYFGSDQSLAVASKEIQKKLAKAFPEGETETAELPHYSSSSTAQANYSGPDSMDTEAAALQEEQEPVIDNGKKPSRRA